MNNQKTKTIIITGASKGLGKAIAESLYQTEFNLILICRHADSIKIPDTVNNNRILIKSVDVTNDSEVNSVVQETVNRFGQIDVLINNAGHFVEKNIDQASISEFDAVFDTNIKGMFIFSRAVVPYMKKNKSGLIINVGSKITHKTNLAPGRTLYATSKYAVEGFSLALQRELQPFRIRVTALLPSTMQTFASFSTRKYLALKDITETIKLIISQEKVNFDLVMFQSIDQYL